MSLYQANNLFLIGIRGTGMRGLAYLLRKMGKAVSGVDRDYDKSKAERLLLSADMLIYSDAVPEDHPLRRQAEKNRIPQQAYHRAAGDLSKNYLTIAVAGTHGKSTTASMLAHIMIKAGLDPTVLLGASVLDWHGHNSRAGRSQYFVVEADEYRDHFLALKPTHAIITTIDFDHPDYFTSLDDVKKSFKKFTRQVAGTVITEVNAPPPEDYLSYNWSLAAAMAQALGIKQEQVTAAKKSWRPPGRRMEEIGSYKGMLIVSDYGHHPAEIAATLRAARQKYPHKKTLAVFEPHTPDRLQAFGRQFARELARADGVLLAPVFMPAGRQGSTKETKRLLARLQRQLSAKSVPASMVKSFSNLPEELEQAAKDFDLALAFTAGELDGRLRKLLKQEVGRR